MHVEYHRWYSHNLGRDMELKVYGNYGKPYIVFPCSNQHFYDYENMGMINAISGFINSGKVKMITVGSVDGDSWYNHSILPGDRNGVYEAYVRYITEEVIPFVRHNCHSENEKPMVTGASMGAYHAINFFLKRPDLFSGVVALSGLYSLSHPEYGIYGYDMPYVYYNSPIHYLPQCHDERLLNLMREGKIYVCTGQGAFEREAVEDTRALDYTMNHDKKLGAHFEYWDYDVAHDWPFWFTQMNHFLHKIHG